MSAALDTWDNGYEHASLRSTQTAQQVNLWWLVTVAGPQITSHQDGLEDPLSTMLRYNERKPYQGKNDRIKWLIWYDDIVIKGQRLLHILAEELEAEVKCI